MSEIVTIIYFSGTGGVKRIANEFDKQMKEKLFDTHIAALDYSQGEVNYKLIDENVNRSKYVFILFPLHAFDAPDPIYEWISKTEAVNEKVIVISVSGGGEVWPNIGTRVACIEALEAKSFKVIYEKMMIMPCNWVFPVSDNVAMLLIKAIPDKVAKIIGSVLSGNIRRTKITKRPAFQSWVSKMEKENASKFAKELSISDTCTKCKWCVNNCPTKNIEIDHGKPYSLDKCIMCFRCVYGCPSKAIKTNDFQILKKGYDLNAVEKRMQGVDLEPAEKCCKGILWAGVRNYLLDKDGY